MHVIGRGERVFEAPAVRGRLAVLHSPDDVLDLMDAGAAGVVALVHDAGATFLAPVYHELTGVICTGGTARSHIAIVSREFQVPCVMACELPEGEPVAGLEVELDCSGEKGVVRG